MRKLLLLLAVLCLGTAAKTNAQTTTTFSENFERIPAEIYEDGWVVSIINGTNNNYGIFESNATILNLGFSGNAIGASTFELVNNAPVHTQDTDIVITTPIMLLPESLSTLSYRIGSVAIANGAASHYSVYVLTQDDLQGIEDEASLEAALDAKMPDDEAILQSESVVASFTLNDYEGQLVIIAFRLHNSPSNSILLVDDVAVTTGTLGDEEFTLEQFTVYPNPATDIVTLQGANGLAFDTVTITDMNGRIVATQQLNGTGGGKVNIGSLNSGMYIITATSDRGTATKKIVKQ